MSNVLSDYKQETIVTLGRHGWSTRRIAREVGVHRETVARYLRAAGVSLRPPGHWGRAPPKPSKEVTGAKPAKEVTAAKSQCEVFRAHIEARVAEGQNAKVIWQDLVTGEDFGGAYESVKRFVRTLRTPQRAQERALIDTPPGEEAQVDYGEGPLVRHPTTGRYQCRGSSL